jgi:type II restriction/modification system DNA methylase subunit YeeA
MLNPETLKILDPACGSGHILVEAYDILKDIYLERGYRLRDIPRLILEKNLYGLDIDDRAAQLAGFALLMKARADDRRILENPLKLNILALVESGDWETPTENSTLEPFYTQLIELFKHAKTFGSLIQIPANLAAQLPAMEAHLRETSQQGDLLSQLDAMNLLPLVEQAHILAMKFDAVIANPPYMGGKGMNPALKEFAKKHFPDSKSDMFSMFMERCQDFGNDAASLSFVTPYVWMFISSYEGIRTKLLNDATLQSLIQLEYNAFEPACVPVCTFIVGKTHIANYTGSYIKLSDFKGHENQAPKTLEAIKNSNCGWFYNAKPDDFKKIPGSPVAYWVSDKVRDVFENGTPFGHIAKPKLGMRTGNNELFIRLWFEVEIKKTGFCFRNAKDAQSSGLKWFPYNKGGEFRRWYGNNENLVNWENDGYEIKVKTLENYPQLSWDNLGWKISNEKDFFKPCLEWSRISSTYLGVRYSPGGFLFDTNGSSAFPEDNHLKFLIAFLCTKLSSEFSKIINPSLAFQPGDLAVLPVIGIPKLINVIDKIATAAISLSKTDWNNYETSWDFTENPLIRQKQPTLKAAFEQWQTQNRAAIIEMKRLEEENNRLFIDAYGLQDELSPDVPEEQITLVRADREKDSVRLISYAIGCMMGRYSLDAEGLIYAHAGNVDFDPARYQSFSADDDGIVPITDEFWFEDDAAHRLDEFLQTVWGAENNENNKTWLAESIGQRGSETADETLRRYLATNFYKDHLQTYKKRPIYWCFSSGKQGAFQALVYLHRYNESTLARMRNNYVVPLMGKLQNRIEMLEKDLDASSTTSKNKIGKEIERFNKKKIELAAFDEKLRHYADMRIQLDLDDGVKVNYGKFGDLLAEVKAVTGGASED